MFNTGGQFIVLFEGFHVRIFSACLLAVVVAYTGGTLVKRARNTVSGKVENLDV